MVGFWSNFASRIETLTNLVDSEICVNANSLHRRYVPFGPYRLDYPQKFYYLSWAWAWGSGSGLEMRVGVNSGLGVNTCMSPSGPPSALPKQTCI